MPHEFTKTKALTGEKLVARGIGGSDYLLNSIGINMLSGALDSNLLIDLFNQFIKQS